MPKEPESDTKETTTAPVPVPVPIEETKAEPVVDQTTAAPIPVQETETEPEPVVATSKDVAPADYANEPIDTTEEHPKTLDPNAVVPDLKPKKLMHHLSSKNLEILTKQPKTKKKSLLLLKVARRISLQLLKLVKCWCNS